MPPTRRKRDATNSMTMPVGDFRSARDPKAGRHDVGAGRGCCASAGWRRRGAPDACHERGRTTGDKAQRQNDADKPGGKGYSEKSVRIIRWPSNNTGLARRNSSRCCHNRPLELFCELSPGGLPHVRLAAVRLRLRPIEIATPTPLNPVLKSKPDLPGVSNGRNECRQANNCCSHPR